MEKKQKPNNIRLFLPSQKPTSLPSSVKLKKKKSRNPDPTAALS